MTTPVLPAPSFPGTIKTFPTRNDGDVIYGEHMNEVDQEVIAIERVLGENPQIDSSGHAYLTVSDRITESEQGTVRTTGNQTIAGTKEFTGTLQADGFLIANGAPVTFKYADRWFDFDDSGLQQYMGDGSTYRDLLLQPHGGQVFRGGNKMWDAGNDGSGSGLDADTVDGHQASEFLLKHGIQVQMAADQTIPFNPPNTSVNAYWRALNLTTVTYEQYAGDATTLWDSTNKCFLLTPGLWAVNWTIAWEAPNNGSRGVRGISNTIGVNSDPSTWTSGMAFGGQYYSGIAPSWWPTTGLTAGNFLDLDQNTQIFAVPNSVSLRVDVWNYCTANAIIHYDDNTHLHQPTSISLAQLA